MREMNVSRVAVISYYNAAGASLMFVALETPGGWFDLSRRKLNLTLLGRGRGLKGIYVIALRQTKPGGGFHLRAGLSHIKPNEGKQMNDPTATAGVNFTAAGIAAFLPGMQHMIDTMQRQLDHYRSMIRALENGGGPVAAKRRGRPPGAANKPKQLTAAPAAAPAAAKKRGGTSPQRIAGIKSYWANMTAEERSAEMRRRTNRRMRTLKAKKRAAAA